MTFVNQRRTARAKLIGLAAIFVTGILVGHVATARTSGLESKIVLTASRSVVGEPIHYPTQQAAKVTAQIITLEPGAATIWHRHPMPTFGFILEGEIEVDYGPRGTRTFRAGDALMEAMAHVHRGRNVSGRPVRALVVSMGEGGQPLAVKGEAPAPSLAE